MTCLNVIQSKEQTHISDLYRSNANLLLAYLTKLGLGKEDAEDLLQDIFLKYIRCHHGVALGSERRYLLVAAKNLVIDRHRQSTIRKTNCSGTNFSFCEELWKTDPNLNDKLEFLDHLMEQVSQKAGGEFFRLYYREGYSLRHISRKFKIPIGTVASKIYRIRNTIKSDLGGQ